MKEMTRNGLRIVDYSSGYSRRADSSVRMNMMDGIRRLNRETQEMFGKEFGADGIEVSHHLYAAPDHIDTIDGRQFSTDGEKTINGIKYQDYDTINNSLDRHVGELNCYHFPMRIVLGISEPIYSKEQLDTDKQANMKGFDFEGNHYTMYEGTQLQRQIETKIRQYKDRQIGARTIDDTDEVYRCQEKIEQLTNKYKELSDISGLPTKIDRLRVDGYRKININKKDNPKIYHKDNEVLQNTLFSDNISIKKWVVPQNATIENVTVIAGQGTSKNIRVKRQLEEKYGSGNWTKVAGTINGKYYSYQVHYYEKNGIQYECKLKEEPKERK